MRARPSALLLFAVTLSVAGCGLTPEVAVEPVTHPIQRHQFQTIPPTAVLNCREAVERMATASPDVGYELVVEGCKDFVREPTCRDAWVESTSMDPLARAPVIARECRRAYCPVLPQPKPVLCGRTLTSLRSDEVSPIWMNFLTAIFARDLGSNNSSQLARLYTHTLLSVTAMPAAEAAVASAMPAVVVRIEESSGGIDVVLSGVGIHKAREFALPRAPSDADLMPVLDSIGTERRGIIITAAGDVRYESVVRLLDGLRAAGFDEFSLSLAAGPAR